MFLDSGDRLLVVHRRLFEKDHPRFFIGTVLDWDGGVAKVSGHSWVFNQMTGKFVKKPDKRTKIIAVSSGTLLVYQLPAGTPLESLELRYGKGGEITLVGPSFEMDLTENLLSHG